MALEEVTSSFCVGLFCWQHCDEAIEVCSNVKKTAPPQKTAKKTHTHTPGEGHVLMALLLGSSGTECARSQNLRRRRALWNLERSAMNHAARNRPNCSRQPRARLGQAWFFEDEPSAAKKSRKHKLSGCATSVACPCVKFIGFLLVAGSMHTLVRVLVIMCATRSSRWRRRLFVGRQETRGGEGGGRDQYLRLQVGRLRKPSGNTIQ